MFSIPLMVKIFSTAFIVTAVETREQASSSSNLFSVSGIASLQSKNYFRKLSIGPCAAWAAAKSSSTI
jgi:hypothetical protein